MDVKTYRQFCGQFWADMHKAKNSNFIIDRDSVWNKPSKYDNEEGIVSQYYYDTRDVDRESLLKVDNYVIYHFDNGKNYYELITFKIVDRVIDENNNLILIASKEVI